MKLFVAGATGATGRVFVPLATAAGHELLLHVRPKSVDKTPLAKDPRARILELSDARSLAEALRGCDAVLSFVGTMRSRFQAGDTYATSDIASTQQLVDGAKAAGVPRLLLLSSIGAGGVGAYLKMKGDCERIVRESGLSWSIFRPSALVTPAGSDGEVSHHGRREAPPLLGGIVSALGHLPGLRGWSDDVRPLPLDLLSRAFLRVLEGGTALDGRIYAGRDIYALA